MSKEDASNDPDLLNLGNIIELLESRKRQLLERKYFCKDQLEFKKIGKELKQIDALLKKSRSTERKVARRKAS
jgi:hypothetical protein